MTYLHKPGVLPHSLPAPQALGPWVKCLEAWARKGGVESEEEEEGPWSVITQPCAALLSSAASGPAPSSEAGGGGRGAPIAAHKALTVILFRAMLLGDEVEGSPHRRPAPAAWAAARAYLLLLALPGAAAYGVLQPAVLGVVLTNLRSWCRNSNVYRPGGGAAGAGGAGGAGAEKKGPQKRRRGDDVADDEADGGGSDGGGDSDEDGGGGRRRAGRGGGRSGGGGSATGEEVAACLRLLKACLACVPLASHQVGVSCCVSSYVVRGGVGGWFGDWACCFGVAVGHVFLCYDCCAGKAVKPQRLALSDSRD